MVLPLLVAAQDLEAQDRVLKTAALCDHQQRPDGRIEQGQGTGRPLDRESVVDHPYGAHFDEIGQRMRAVGIDDKRLRLPRVPVIHRSDGGTLPMNSVFASGNARGTQRS